MTDTIASTAAVESAINQAVAGGLPRPEWQVIGGDSRPFINLGLANPADVDRWAGLVAATVAYEQFTYTNHKDSTQFHQYGTSADTSVFGQWLGRAVYLGCTIRGPHPTTA